MECRFILYGTEGCHLCEDAETLIEAADIVYAKIDIVDDETAWQHYRLRIPVLLHTPSQREFDWPFSVEQLQQFLQTKHQSKT